MTDHTHTVLTPGCFRCDLNKDELGVNRLMTGAEHYREAEVLLKHVMAADPDMRTDYYRRAQIHATLALAAATYAKVTP